LWSDGATKERFISLPPGARIHVLGCAAESADCADPDLAEGDDGQFQLPVGTVLVKSFSVGGRRVETRLLMRRTALAWRGFSYEWNDAGTEATLLEDEKSRTLESQTWHYPSPSQCMECHTKAAGRALGLSVRQLDRVFPYPDGSMNQLQKLAALGLFDVPPKRLAPYPDPLDGTASLDQRARSYLHSNCATCHRPLGSFASLDLRFTTPMSDTRLCTVPSERDKGVDSPVPHLRLVPGRPTESALSFRMRDVNRYRMPTLGSSVIDLEGVALIDAWITNLADCSSPQQERL
jgi:uncharacterized repeat protein (TIGR03806 family)